MSLEDFRKVRIEKLEKLRNAGVDAYPASSARTHQISAAINGFDQIVERGDVVVLAGRILAQRGHGALTFWDIDDGSGTIQVLLKQDALGDEAYAFMTQTVDIGDFVEVTGKLFHTKRNERTVDADGWRMLTKSIRPLPEKWSGLQDMEQRYRARYLDLIFNPEVKANFLKRFEIIRLVREFFYTQGFAEVETPVLQVIPGGATARPFMTHMNSLDLDLYLRVAPELYLKRLLVGGMDRVFEIGKNFRNEGMDREHNPEFTMLEAYAAYKDYEWLMGFTEDLFIMLMEKFTTTRLSKPFRRMTFNELVKEASGLDFDQATAEDFAKRARELDVVIEKSMTKSTIADEIYKKTLRHKMIDPVFVTDHPLELSPLAKKINSTSDKVARFQLLIGGLEMTNAFSELNDPLDQLERFEAQQKLREAGDEEAQHVDMDYVQALEYGMPPAAGIGIGIDRLCLFLTNSASIRDILLFPTMKPKAE